MVHHIYLSPRSSGGFFCPPQPQARALAIGNFDGVHHGHQALLQKLCDDAASHNLRPTVLTFHPHPLRLLQRPAEPLPLFTLRDKLACLAQTGVQEVLLQRFTPAFAALPPANFVKQYLVQQWQVKYLLVGENFRFGKGRSGDTTLPLQTLCGDKVSSGRIRQELADSNFNNHKLATVQNLLKRPYLISGRVRHGKKLGRTLGFPTLNLAQPTTANGQALLNGIFVVAIHGLGLATLYGVASAGRRPTVEQGGQPLLEVHVFNFAKDCYHRHVRIEFLHYLRGEEKFPDLTTMQQQMEADRNAAIVYLQQTDRR